MTTLQALPINPVPSGATVGAFPGYDGTKLRFALWAPTRGPSRGTFAIFPGRGECIEKYFEVIADIRRRSFAVAILDWRGQGGSERALANPRKGHVVSFNEYDRDLASFMTSIVLPSCPKPYFALCHSMGGNVMLRHIRSPKSWFERVVLVSPMIAIHKAQMQLDVRLVRLYAEAASLAGLGPVYIRGGSDQPFEYDEFEGNALTGDMVRWSRNKAIYEAAPNLALGSPTIGWLRSALRSCAVLGEPRYAKTVKVPALMFSAANDTVVDPQTIEDFGAALKVGSTIRLPTARHEILQESDAIRQMFWAAFDSYMSVDAVIA